MPIDIKTIYSYLRPINETINNNTYLSKRKPAFRQYCTAQTDYEKALVRGENPPKPELDPIFSDPDNQKTSLFDWLPQILNNTSFIELLKSIEDGNKAEEYLKSLSDHLKLLWELEIPSLQNHGLEKILEPEDYQKLQNSYDQITKQTSDLTNYFLNLSRQPDQQENHPADRLKTLKAFSTILNKDAGLFKNLLKEKASVPMNVALKNAQGIRVTGEMRNVNTIGGAQSSRKVITVRKKDGTEVTGLFTPQKLVTDDPDEMVNQIATGDMGAEVDDRLDNRNSAMSDVADLLGRSDLLAYSREMKIDSEITPDNPTGTGTFMEAVVNGTDSNRMLPDDPYFNVDIEDKQKDIYTNSAKKDMMDLSIIDYLCGNVDRHSGNIIYRYEKDNNGKTRMSGLVGIDNDSSFTELNLNVAEPFNRLGALTETLCISESMAKKLANMTNVSLDQAMNEYNLGPTALTAMKSRLSNLKGALKRGIEFQENNLKTEEEWNAFLNDAPEYMTGKLGDPHNRMPCLVIIPDERLSMLKADSLARTQTRVRNDGSVHHSGVFNVVDNFHSPRERKANLKDANRNQKKHMGGLTTSTVLNEGVNIKAVARAAQKETYSFITQCQKKTSSLYGTSNEFDAVVNRLTQICMAAKNMSHKEGTPSEMEVNELNYMYKMLQDDCNQYLKRKNNQAKNGKRHGSYAKKRIKLVKQILENAELTQNRIRGTVNEEISDFNIKIDHDEKALKNGKPAAAGPVR